MKKILVFPAIEKHLETLTFKTINSHKSFKTGKFNIPEPTNDNYEIIPQLFFVPCLGFHLKGFRIGHGGGFYDKTFSGVTQPEFIGLAYEFQFIKKLKLEDYDLKLDTVFTDKQLL